MKRKMINEWLSFVLILSTFFPTVTINPASVFAEGPL